MFARFDENPAMTLRVIKETKRYGRTDARTDGRTDGQRENSISPTNKVCGGYNKHGHQGEWLIAAKRTFKKALQLSICLFLFWNVHGIRKTCKTPEVFMIPKGASLTLQETRSIHDSMSIPKNQIYYLY